MSAAGSLDGTGFTWAYASPELLASLKTPVSLCDDMIDTWAMAVIVHYVLTCTDKRWHTAFEGKFIRDSTLPADKQDAAVQANLEHQQQKWVC